MTPLTNSTLTTQPPVMARPPGTDRQPPLPPTTGSRGSASTEPEIRLFGLRNVGPAMWAMVEVIAQGDRILAITEAEADARAPTIGRIVRRIEKVV